MPKSKRERVVSLSKTRKNSVNRKDALIGAIRECVEKYDRLYLLRVRNLKSKDMDMMRKLFEGRLFVCKNSLFRAAIGATEEDEAAPGISEVVQSLRGSLVSVFTSQTDAQLAPLFAYTRVMYAKQGAVAPMTVTLHRDDLAGLDHSTEPYVRALGVDCKLERGQIVVLKEKVVCTEGKVMSANEALPPVTNRLSAGTATGASNSAAAARG